NSSIIPQGLTHQRELGLMITRYRYASGMYLSKARISEIGALLMCFPYSGSITAHCICRKEEYISISATAEKNGMTKMTFNFSGDKISRNNSSCLSINDHHFMHFMPRIHFHVA